MTAGAVFARLKHVAKRPSLRAPLAIWAVSIILIATPFLSTVTVTAAVGGLERTSAGNQPRNFVEESETATPGSDAAMSFEESKLSTLPRGVAPLFRQAAALTILLPGRMLVRSTLASRAINALRVLNSKAESYGGLRPRIMRVPDEEYAAALSRNWTEA